MTYIHTDGLGSPVARTNEQGELISRTRYEPYGATAGGATPGIGFTGHVNDPETGLTYMQQRYYDPLAGRFMSVDPVLTDNNTGASFNRYVYGLNNPYKYIDPDGRQVIIIIGRRPTTAGNPFDSPVGLSPTSKIETPRNNNTAMVACITLPVLCAMSSAESPKKSGGANDNTSDSPPPPDDDGPNTKVKDSTTGRSVRNTDASISRADFEKNLESNGFQKSPTKNEGVYNFTKGDVKYTVRDFSNSRGPTVDVYRGGDLVQKIRLIGGP